MRKGWFKKAKRKFVKKRVYRWKLCAGHGQPAKEEIEFLRSGGLFGRSATIKFSSHDRIYQILEKARDYGFVQGFWYAREIIKKDEFFYFWFDKRI